MPVDFDKDRFAALPLWGQVLLASRMVRRGALAMFDGDAFIAMRDVVTGACDAIERCAVAGGDTGAVMPVFKRAMALRDSRVPSAVEACAQSIWWAIDAARCAEAAMDFPVDATVTNSARNAMGALAADRRVNSLQLFILAAADLDQIAFACSEVHIGKYDGVTAHVIGRLAPVHPLTLIQPQPSPEELAR
jgi:hypothetical protein